MHQLPRAHRLHQPTPPLSFSPTLTIHPPPPRYLSPSSPQSMMSPPAVYHPMCASPSSAHPPLSFSPPPAIHPPPPRYPPPDYPRNLAYHPRNLSYHPRCLSPQVRIAFIRLNPLHGSKYNKKELTPPPQAAEIFLNECAPAHAHAHAMHMHMRPRHAPATPMHTPCTCTCACTCTCHMRMRVDPSDASHPTPNPNPNPNPYPNQVCAAQRKARHLCGVQGDARCRRRHAEGDGPSTALPTMAH